MDNKWNGNIYDFLIYRIKEWNRENKEEEMQLNIEDLGVYYGRLDELKYKYFPEKNKEIEQQKEDDKTYNTLKDMILGE